MAAVPLNARGENSVRVLHVVPAAEGSIANIFIKRQIESLREEGVDCAVFYLQSRLSPRLLIRDWSRFRRMASAHRSQLAHAQYGSVTALFTVLACPVPVVITFRGSDLNPTLSVSPLRSALQTLFSRLAALACREVICVSRPLASRLWFRGRRASIIPSGVDTALFRPLDHDASRRQLGWPLGVPTVLFYPSRNPEVKGFDLAQATIQCARRVRPELELRLVNDIAPEMMPVLMAAADVLLFTSPNEGSPNIVKEAICCGLPVVSVPVGDVPDRLEGTHPSAIASPNSQALADALLRILDQPKRSNGPENCGSIDGKMIAQQIKRVYMRALGYSDPRLGRSII